MLKNVLTILVLSFALFFTGCESSTNKESIKITLNRSSITLDIGEEYQLIATASGLKNSDILWSSKNNLIAEVSEGKVKAVAAGTTEIIAESADGKNETECKITVTSNSITQNEVFNNSDLNYVFDLNSLPDVTVEISETEWNKLLTNFDANPKNEDEVSATFIFNKNGTEEKLENIGFRLRGNTSRFRPEGSNGQLHNSVTPEWHHAHFALKFDKFVKDTKFHNLKGINMKYFKDDSNYCREVYSYDLFRRFSVWTAPFSSYVKFSIKIAEDGKKAYFGVYEMIEPVDGEFIKKRFPNDNGGNLWKCLYQQNGPADLKNKDVLSKMGLEDPAINYFPTYDLKTNKKSLATAKLSFETFINNLNSKSDSEFEQWVASNIDIDLFLRATAVDVAVGMWDDYWVNGNNYYLYFDSSNKMYFIPYDYDNTLGTSYFIDSASQNPLYWGDTNNRPLVKRIMAIEANKNKYKEYLKNLISKDRELFYYKYSMARILSWQNGIKDFVANNTWDGMAIIDSPAFWSNNTTYRLNDDNEKNNFFRVKEATILNSCK